MTGVADPIARAREIVAFGVNLVLFHRSIDEEVTRGAAWDDQARQTVDALCNLGLDVAVAGGVESDVITLLGRSPLYAIVVGRAISAQADLLPPPPGPSPSKSAKPGHSGPVVHLGASALAAELAAVNPLGFST